MNLEAALEVLADAVAAKVVERMSAGQPGWIDQHASPLGPKKHCAAVRRRVAKGLADAATVGRRHLLSPAALSEELASQSRRHRGAQAEAVARPAGSVAAELAAELRLVQGGRP
jgi:hypothetical protein